MVILSIAYYDIHMFLYNEINKFIKVHKWEMESRCVFTSQNKIYTRMKEIVENRQKVIRNKGNLIETINDQSKRTKHQDQSRIIGRYL